MAAPHIRTFVALAGLLAVGRLLISLAVRVRRSWPGRVAVTGRSMAPGLLPGDWLLVEPLRAGSPPAKGDLVVVPDPRQPVRLLVKRVSAVERDGGLRLQGDAPDSSTNSRTFGPVDGAAVLGRPWFRYWPAARFGRIR